MKHLPYIVILKAPIGPIPAGCLLLKNGRYEMPTVKGKFSVEWRFIKAKKNKPYFKY